MLVDQLQQFELQWKQTCLVTCPSATVGWFPFNQPVARVLHLFMGTHAVGIFLPAPSVKRYQPDFELSHSTEVVAHVAFLLDEVNVW